MSSPRACGAGDLCGLKKALGLESRTNALALFVSVNLFYFLAFAMGKSVVSLCCYLLLAPITLGVFLKALHLTPAEEGPWEVVSRCSSFFEHTLHPLIAPYVKMANQALHDLFRSIPTMEESNKKL
ncbi:hypothetical protein Efla_002082 [Eimeria flavescens]